MNTQMNWKRLIAQAFSEIQITESRTSKCGFLCVYEYIYLALNHAGIENRSPFNLWQIISISFRAKGDASKIKALCLQSLEQIQQPFSILRSNSFVIGLISLPLFLLALLPQTATTAKAPVSENTVLKIKPQPIEDIDKIEITWPSTSDYQLAANQFLGHPIIYERNNGILESDWINSQQDSAYALQIISTSQLPNLFKFCQKHKICNKSVYYQSQVKGKTFYRLLYGNYRNHQAAKTARLNLPVELQKLNPWPRQFKQIKTEL